MAEQARQNGTVKWFNTTKGYGFISPSGGGEDLFVHQSNINAEGFRSLREGEAVEYDLEPGPDGRQKAVNVTGPAGAAPQGAPPKVRAPNPAYASGRGGRGFGRAQAAAGAYSGFGYPGMPPVYWGYYYPQDPTAGRGRGRGRGQGAAGMMFPSAVPGMASPMQPLEQPSGLQVVVHNLPWSCSWQQLKDLFKEYKAERSDVIQDQWGRSRGFGTVRFATTEDADAACKALNNTQLDGRTISVRIDRFA